MMGLTAMGWFHPGSGLLLRYAESSLGERERQRVSEHLKRCARCREEVETDLEALRWLGQALRREADPAVEAIRRRLVEVLRGERRHLDWGDCARVCLGHRSFEELARRVRGYKGGAPELLAVAGPLLETFVGRKAVARLRGID